MQTLYRRIVWNYEENNKENELIEHFFAVVLGGQISLHLLALHLNCFLRPINGYTPGETCLSEVSPSSAKS